MKRQDELRKQLKLQKLEQNDFSYQDIAGLLNIKLQSVYNFTAGSYNLSAAKAKILKDWLDDRKE